MRKNLLTAVFIVMLLAAIVSVHPIRAAPNLQDDINTAIDNGLVWLHSKQESDGRWEEQWGDVGATSLAVLCYMHHYLTYANLPADYQSDVEDAITYILGKQDALTGKFQDVLPTYETSLAIMALNAMNDPSYNDEIQKARDWLINNQNDWANKYFGGWYYYEKTASWSDLSNTHFAVMGLKVADDVVGGVPGATWDDAETFISRCQNDKTLNPHYYTRDDGGGFVYMPSDYDTPDTGFPWRESSYGSMTAAGIWSLMLIPGIDTPDPRVQAGLNWLISNFDATRNVGSEDPQPDWYYYYYAWAVTKAFIICGNEPEVTDPTNWYYKLADYLVHTKQVTDPLDPMFGSWVTAPPWEDPVVATEFALLVLEKSTGITPPTIAVYVDIKPSSWPNPINTGSKGVFAVAICGTEDFDVTTIDPTTVKIYIEGMEEGVSPIRWSYEDVATPYTGPPDEGHDLGPDGYVDLVFLFDTQTVVTLTLSEHVGETIPLIIKGNLCEVAGGTDIMGQDYVMIIKPKAK